MANDRHFIEGDTFDDIYGKVVENVIMHPQYICSPRGSKIKENIGVTLKLNDPRARLITLPSRDVNYGFGVGEFLWYWQGKNDLETMLYYNKRMKAFSDDGVTLNSAYGFRLKNQKTTVEDASDGELSVSTLSQWQVAKRTLISDPDSRRCILLINRPTDQHVAVSPSGAKDVPCTLSLQFFIRENKLDLHVHMRSNDVFWGLTYDLFSFTLFQECMLLELQRESEKFKDLKLGTYYHTAGSLHIYETHFKQAEDVLGDVIHKRATGAVMHPLSLEDLAKVCVVEHGLRTKTESTATGITSHSAMWMVEQLANHRIKRTFEEATK